MSALPTTQENLKKRVSPREKNGILTPYSIDTVLEIELACRFLYIGIPEEYATTYAEQFRKEST
jgi:hypothetical protein